jgi:two-component system NarL family sensor kinase
MEAIQNAAKHSQAGTVSVRVDENPDRWRLTVTDDGSGFDQTQATASSGVGLANMRDRLDAIGGSVEILSSERTGTTVTAVVPRTSEAVIDRAILSLPHPVG